MTTWFPDTDIHARLRRADGQPTQTSAAAPVVKYGDIPSQLAGSSEPPKCPCPHRPDRLGAAFGVALAQPRRQPPAEARGGALPQAPVTAVADDHGPRGLKQPTLSARH